MTIVYRNQIEAGGMEFDDDRYQTETDCPECGSTEAVQYIWEQCDSGCINSYHRLSCHVCGHSEGNDDRFESYDDFDFSAFHEEEDALENAWFALEKNKYNPMHWLNSYAEKISSLINCLRYK